MSNQTTLLEIYKTQLNKVHEEKSNQMKIANYIFVFYAIICFITISNKIQYNLPKNISYIFVVIASIFGVYYLLNSQMQIFKLKKMIAPIKKERWELSQFLGKEENMPSEGLLKLAFMILLVISGPVVLSKIILNLNDILFFFTAILLILATCVFVTYTLTFLAKLMKSISLA